MITKDQVQKALGALEGHLPETVAKGGSGDDLGDPEGAAAGGGDGSLKAPGEKMSGKAPKGKAVKKGEFPPPKAKDDDDEDDEDDDKGDDEGDDDDDEDDGMKGKKAPPFQSKKSRSRMPGDFSKSLPAEVTTKVEVSTFLRSLVDHTADSVDGLRDFVAKSDMANENRYDEVMAAVETLQKSLGAVGIVLRAVCERIGVVENQPARVAKSQTAASAPQAQPVARTFVDPNAGGTTEAQPEGMFKSLAGKPAHVAKAMVSEVLCDLVKKGDAKDTDVINFETFGFVPPELQPKLAAALN